MSSPGYNSPVMPLFLFLNVGAFLCLQDPPFCLLPFSKTYSNLNHLKTIFSPDTRPSPRKLQPESDALLVDTQKHLFLPPALNTCHSAFQLIVHCLWALWTGTVSCSSLSGSPTPWSLPYPHTGLESPASFPQLFGKGIERKLKRQGRWTERHRRKEKNGRKVTERETRGTGKEGKKGGGWRDGDREIGKERGKEREG